MSKLRLLARGRDCTVRIPEVCCGDPATVVLAHFRMPGISGLGLKPPDLIGAYACFRCHSYIDAHSDAETQLAFAHGVFRTQYKLIQEGVIRA